MLREIIQLVQLGLDQGPVARILRRRYIRRLTWSRLPEAVRMAYRSLG